MPSSYSRLGTDGAAVRGVSEISNYSMYGLRIQSEIPLGASEACAWKPPDLIVHLSRDPASGGSVPDGDELASLDVGEGRGYAFVRGRDDYRLAFYGVCDFQ